MIHRLALSLILLLSIAFSSSGEESKLSWADDYEAVTQWAVEHKRPVLIEFTASWCGYCKMMKENVYPKAGVQKALRGFTRLTIDADDRPDLVGRYQAHGLPMYVRLDEKGRELGKLKGYADANRFQAWLMKKMVYQSDGSLVSDQKWEAIEKTFKGKNEKEKTQLVEQLLDKSIIKRSVSHERSITYVKSAIQKNPKHYIHFLNDELLARRIVIANIYAELYKETFKFDPWDKKDERQKAIDNFVQSLK